MLLGANVQGLAEDLGADQVLYADHPTLADFKPGPYQRIVANLLREHQPRLVLFGETSIGAEIAGALSIRLDAPLVS